MTKDEALKLAFDAIETYAPDYMHGLPKKHYVKAIKEALAQPEQELVGKFAKFTDGLWREVTKGSAGQLLYTSPQPTEELKQAIEELNDAKPEQEPVAWLEPEWGEKICPEVGYEVTMTDDHPKDLCWIPLYPKREWVGLTDDEVSEIIGNEIGFNACWGPEEDFAKAIEAKLKEKNNG